MQKFWQKWSPLRPCDPENNDLSISKSLKEEDPSRAKTKLWCESWLMTEEEDSDKDIMLAREVDLEFYKSNGYMCHEHPSLALTLVGRNIRAWVEEHPSGHLGVKQRGYFYGNDTDGKKLYEKMIMLSEAEDDPLRHLGTSAEGKSHEAVKRPEGGHFLKKNKIWGTAVTHRPKNKGCRFTQSEYDIACSLHEAATQGYLRQHLEVLLKNLEMSEKILSFNKSKAIDPQVEQLVSKYGMSTAQAEAFLTKVRNVAHR